MTDETRFVAFNRGEHLLRALSETTLHVVADGVLLRSTREPAAAKYRASHPALSGNRAAAFEASLRPFGAEPTALPPEIGPGEAWSPPLDAVLGMPLVPTEAYLPADECVVLLRDSDALRTARDLLASFRVPFRLGALDRAGTVWNLFVEASLGRPGLRFVADSFAAHPGCRVLVRQPAPDGSRVRLLVETGFRHQAPGLLVKIGGLESERLPGEWLFLLTAHDVAIRAVVGADATLDYFDAVRLTGPVDSRPVVAATAQARSAVKDLLDGAGLHEIEFRLCRRPGRARTGRGTRDLRTEVAQLRMQHIRTGERLATLEREAGMSPRSWGYRNLDPDALLDLVASVPPSLAQLLLVAEADAGPAGRWTLIVPARHVDVVNLSDAHAAGWMCFLGESDRPDEPPVVWIPETHEPSLPVAMLGRTRLLGLLGTAGGERAAYRFLLPDEAGSWVQVVVGRGACVPLLDRAYRIRAEAWRAVDATPPPGPMQALVSPLLEAAFDGYAESLEAAFVERMDTVDQRISQIRKTADRVLGELKEKKEWLDEVIKALAGTDELASRLRIQPQFEAMIEVLRKFERTEGKLAKALQRASDECEAFARRKERLQRSLDGGTTPPSGEG